jgi:diacylglycerol kinase (ATP)
MSAGRPLLIVNPSSGKMGGPRSLARFTAAVERALGDVDFAATERRGHAIDLARRGADEGRETIVAVGGDGTLNEVVNGVMRAGAAAAGARVGLIGLGTGGDFGHSLGIGRGLADYLAAIAGGHTRRVDLLRVAFHGHDGRPLERYVVNVLSVGPGGLVDRYVEKIPGLLGGRVSYGMASAWALAACPRARLRLLLTGLAGDPSAGRVADPSAGLVPDPSAARAADDVATRLVEREVSTYLLGLCNGAVFGGGMRLAPDALPDDGLLDVVSVGCDSKWTVARHLPKVYGGRHLGVPGVELLRCRAVEVELLDAAAGARFALDVDGEPLGRLPLKAELMPGALTMLAPAPVAAGGDRRDAAVTP